jgi:hypothetical protein
MPHRKLKFCAIKHRYRAFLHDDGCSDDVIPHFHAKCRRCRFHWWQPTLFGGGPIIAPAYAAMFEDTRA